MHEHENEIILASDTPETEVKNDKLKMIDYAQNLANTITNYNNEDSLTININGKWGEGKTTFSNYVKHFIKNNKNISVIDSTGSSFFEKHSFCHFLAKVLCYLVVFLIKIILAVIVLLNFNWALFSKIIIVSFICFLPIKQLLYKFLDLNKIKNWLKIKWNSLRIPKIKSPENIFIIFDFNPWSYDNIDSLISNFIDTLKKECIYINGDLFEKISAYQKIIKNEDVSMSLLLEIFKWIEDKSINKLDFLKNKINKIIKKSKIKFVIFIDDIDRLNKSEMLNLCKLLKSVANFQNTIYVLPFDREYVAQILNDEFVNGNDYLEKITTFNINLRKTNQETYKDILLENFIHIANKVNEETVKKAELKTSDKLAKDLLENFKVNYSQNYHILFENKFRTIRQIKRYLNFVNFLFDSEEINIYDFLNITAIQYFYPHIYSLIYTNKELLCKEYPLLYELYQLKRNIFNFISNINEKINSKNETAITIYISNEKITLDDNLLALKLKFENFRLNFQKYTNQYDEKIKFINNNIIKNIYYIKDSLLKKNYQLVNIENEKLKEHFEREFNNIKIILKDFYSIENDKIKFLKFIEDCHFDNNKQDSLISFFINLFPNLNILFDFSYDLTNANLYLFRFQEDSLRDRRLFNKKTFANYFEYEKYPVTLKAIKSIFNLMLDTKSNNEYLEIYNKLKQMNRSSYCEYIVFVDTIQDSIMYETSSFLGAGLDIFYEPYKEYTKGLILAYSLPNYQYSRYEEKYKKHPNHKDVIRYCILKMIAYFKNPNKGKEMFIESIKDLINNSDIIQNIKDIDCLICFMNDLQGLQKDYEKYQNHFEITDDELNNILKSIINRLQIIIPTNETLNKYNSIAYFLYKNSQILGEDFIFNILIDFCELKNEKMKFIKQYPERNIFKLKRYFLVETPNGTEYKNVSETIYYWQSLNEQ